MKRLLLVEDEDVILRALTRFLTRRGFEVTGASTVELAALAAPASFDVVLADLRLPGAEGTEVIPLADPTPVVVMTSHASVRSAVDVMRAGATDYIAKPFDHDELLLVLERAIRRQRLSAENRALRAALERERPLHHRLAGTSLDARCDSIVAGLHAHERAPIWVHGEPGSAREALARGLHERLRGADAPFVVADLPTLSAEARTGDALDVFLRDARHGSLVLRHPELLERSARDALLPSCAAADVMPIVVGLDAPTASERAGALDASFVAAFELVVEAPALRLRADDATLLARRAVAQAGARLGRVGLALDAAAENWIRARDWPGNVPELDGVVQRAVARTRGDSVGVRELANEADEAVPHGLSLDEYFRWFVLRHQGGASETELAARLGISRKALWERRQREHLPRPTPPAAAAPPPAASADAPPSED